MVYCAECRQLYPCDGSVCRDLTLSLSERQACIKAGTAWWQDYREHMKAERNALRREIAGAQRQVARWEKESRQPDIPLATVPRKRGRPRKPRVPTVLPIPDINTLREQIEIAATKLRAGVFVDALRAANRINRKQNNNQSVRARIALTERVTRREVERTEKVQLKAESKRRHAELMELYKAKREARTQAWAAEKLEVKRHYAEAKVILARYAENKSYGPGRRRYATPQEFAKARKEYKRAYALVWAQDRGYSGSDESSLKRALRKGAEIGNRPALRAFYRRMRDPHETVYCMWCSDMTPLAVNERTADHVIPLAQGGKHCATNLVYACRSCNSSKGAMLPDDFVEKLLREE